MERLEVVEPVPPVPYGGRWSRARGDLRGVGVSGATYEIVVQGRLGRALAGWFDDLDVRASGTDSTQLSGWFADQAALQGLLRRLSDLGLELSAVRRVPDDG